MLGCTSNQECSIWKASASADSGALGFPSIFCGVSAFSIRGCEGKGECGSGVLIADEADGIGNKAAGDTTNVDVETLLEDFQAWDCFPELSKSQDFQCICIQIKGILL
jgi:hypothetical protein